MMSSGMMGRRPVGQKEPVPSPCLCGMMKGGRVMGRRPKGRGSRCHSDPIICLYLGTICEDGE